MYYFIVVLKPSLVNQLSVSACDMRMMKCSEQTLHTHISNLTSCFLSSDDWINLEHHCIVNALSTLETIYIQTVQHLLATVVHKLLKWVAMADKFDWTLSLVMLMDNCY